MESSAFLFLGRRPPPPVSKGKPRCKIFPFFSAFFPPSEKYA